tara:strand:+ start:1434 stop:2702 length:1269 start_codon:yes stop_codon:yes gene_type:complete
MQSPRGTVDILPNEQIYWRYIENVVRQFASKYSYNQISTPTFESSELFSRSVGQFTDIVKKETYSFDDRGGHSLTLRPEGTASVCRSYLQHGMHNQPQPVRLFYIMPMYRYERPQLGRYRQFHQFGIELLGDDTATVDFEVIEFATKIIAFFGLKQFKLNINSLGDKESRDLYREAILNYFSAYSNNLSEDDSRRLEENPLRILDSKDKYVKSLFAKAPNSLDYLSQASKDRWEKLLTYLRDSNIEYYVNTQLVRGLDYYTHTVFEFMPIDGGSQSTILAGGRYDGLVEELGGPSVPGIGFAMGIERIVEELKKQDMKFEKSNQVDVVICCIGGEEEIRKAVNTAYKLRNMDIKVILAPMSKSIKGQMRYAGNLSPPYVVILGSEEIKKDTYILKDMIKNEQKEIKFEILANFLAKECIDNL